jgi:hypothetical protein
MRWMLAVFIVILSSAPGSGALAARAVLGPEGWEVSLLSFGARCDGQTNDARAIQAAFDAARAVSGTVVWPAQTCATSTGIVMGGDGDRTGFVGIRGATSNTSILRWTGSPSGVALTISHNKYFKVEGFTVANGVARGTTQGLQLTGPLTVGTQTLAGQFERVNVAGFNVGVQVGASTGKAASEMQWTMVSFVDNDIGLRTADQNTLDQQFHMLLCSHNGICVQHQAGELWVDGGSATGDRTTDFDFAGSSFGVATIRNFRTEGERRFITGQVPNLTVESCTVTPSSGDDHIVIEMAQSGYLLSIRDSELWGYVKYTQMDGPNGLIIMENNRVRTDTNLPLMYGTTSGSGNRQGNVTARFVNNLRALPADGNHEYRLPDYPFFNFQHASEDPIVTILRANDPQRKPNDSQPIDMLQFNRVKTLAEGGYANGRNLRLVWQFPGNSATVPVTFSRKETVGVTAWRHDRRDNEMLGYDTIAVGAGRFTQGDVGKRIVVSGACDGGADCVGVVKAIADATHVVMQFKSGNVSGNGFRVTNPAASATIGEDEPDALYLPIVSCDAQETISWSNLTPAGLTLTSSNPASRATCVVLIVR